MEKQNYIVPEVEVYEFISEKGFAVSGDIEDPTEAGPKVW